MAHSFKRLSHFFVYQLIYFTVKDIYFADENCNSQGFDMDLQYDFPFTQTEDLCQLRGVENLNIESDNDHVLNIYPNPTTGIVNIQFSGSDSQKIIIMDLSGRILFESIALGNEKVDLTNYKAGTYLINIINQSTGETQTKKIQLIK